jgi:hypothetical protein
VTDDQLQKLLAVVGSLKVPDGLHWETVIPVFVSALLAMCVGILLEHYKTRREEQRTERKKREEELTQINIATIALAYNLELVIHAIFQNILPHYENSHAAFNAIKKVPNQEPELARFVRTASDAYPHMMMTAPDYNFLEHDFLGKLPFVLSKEPELLKQANWLIDHTRELRGHLRERNAQIELANRQDLNGGTLFSAIRGIIQIQASISNAECNAVLSVIDRIPEMAQTLERVGRTYKNAGTLSTLKPPEALKKAVTRLRAIRAPLEAAMPDRQAE